MFSFVEVPADSSGTTAHMLLAPGSGFCPKVGKSDLVGKLLRNAVQNLAAPWKDQQQMAGLATGKNIMIKTDRIINCVLNFFIMQ